MDWRRSSSSSSSSLQGGTLNWRFKKSRSANSGGGGAGPDWVTPSTTSPNFGPILLPCLLQGTTIICSNFSSQLWIGAFLDGDVIAVVSGFEASSEPGCHRLHSCSTGDVKFSHQHQGNCLVEQLGKEGAGKCSPPGRAQSDGYLSSEAHKYGFHVIL